MHSWVLSIFICCTFITHAQIPKVFDYCYQNKKGICVYSLETKNELVISIKGDFPYISPDGKEITFTQNINGGGRNICTMNLTTNEIKVLKINSQSCFGSVWSPNGYFIAYNVIYKGENTNWGVAIIDTGNHKPINITSKGINEKFGYFSPTWSANSEFILAQNLDTLYIFNLKGKVKLIFNTSVLLYIGIQPFNCV